MLTTYAHRLRAHLLHRWHALCAAASVATFVAAEQLLEWAHGAPDTHLGEYDDFAQGCDFDTEDWATTLVADYRAACQESLRQHIQGAP